MKKLYLTLAVATVFLTFFASVLFNGKTLSSTAITPGVGIKGVFGYNGHVMKTLPIKDPGAYSWHHYPLMNLNSQAYRSAQLPLWNPYNGMGQPLVADQQSGGFSPMYLPLFVNSSLLSWDLFMILRLVIAFIFTYLLARRLKLGQKASFLAGAAFALTGYFWFFITMNHLTIEVLIPAAFYFAERLFQEAKVQNGAGLGAVFGLALLSGMPESSFLLIVISSVYLFIRLLGARKESSREFVQKRLLFWGVSIALGFALSAALLLPFFEYLQNSLHGHGGEIGKAVSPVRGLADLFIPNFSWPGKNWTNINRHFAFHYVGVLPLVLAIAAFKKSWPYKIFAGIAVFYVLKSVGFPVVNEIGSLPVFKSVFYPKYLAPYFALSIAILAAGALSSIKEISFKRAIASSAIWASAAGIVVLFYWQTIVSTGFRGEVAARLAVPVVIIGLFVLAVYLYKKEILPAAWVSTLIVALVVVELFIYLPNERSTRHNPEKAPPYIKYLKRQKGDFRVMATDRLLFPNMSAPLKVNDIRVLNALVIDRYKIYMSAFMDRVQGGHVTGHEKIDYDSSLFDLTGTRFVVSTTELGSRITADLIRNAKPKPQFMKVGGRYEAILTSPATYTYGVTVPPSAAGLTFKSSADSSVSLNISSEGIEPISVDLGENEQKIDINIATRSATQTIVTFKLDSQAGVKVKIKELIFKNKKGSRRERFKVVYDKDVLIYENEGALPRAFVAYDYKKVANAEAALAALSEGTVDSSKTVVLEETLKERFERRKTKPTRAKIIKAALNKLRIEVKNPRAGLLFLADNYYPGWTALVNGKKTKIYRANYTFRAVPVPKGNNVIEFIYRPASVTRGIVISILSLLILITLLLLPALLGKKPKSSDLPMIIEKK